jgi:muramidase (phage lysozyme)
MTVSDNRPRDSAGRYAPWNTPDGRAPQPKPPRRSTQERQDDRAAKQQAKEAEKQQRQKDRDAQQRDAIESGVAKALKKTGAWGAFWDLIKFSFHCGICVFAVEQTNLAADWGFAIRSNAQAITAGFDSCTRDPIGCAQGKYFISLRWGKPTDNLTAMLDTIAWAEGTNDKYNIAYTGATFASYEAHPRQIYCANEICSDAAGRYQFLSTTWGPIADRLKLPDFSPASQDRAAIQLLKDNNCYGAAVRGDVRSMADRCWAVWASLKSSKGQKLDARQNTHSIERLKAKYQEFLGKGRRSIVPPLAKMTMTSPFSPSRINPVSGQLQPHNGADYACALGEIVRAPIGGIFRQGNSDPKGFGNNWGSIEAQGQTIILGHTRKLLVQDGQPIEAGALVAECGAEGLSTGPHLHLEIRREGVPIYPAKAFQFKG